MAFRIIFRLVLMFLLGDCVCAKADDRESGPPNVVFILADDLGWGEVGCFGQQKIPTPNIDALAKRGTRLTTHYSGAPVCAPSRCVLMTGLHTGHCLIRGNQQAKVQFPEFEEGQHPLAENTPTLAKAFQKAGYVTGAIGKWGLGPVGSSGDPNRQGFDLFYGYNCQALAHSYYPKYLWRNQEKQVVNQHPIPGHKKKPEGDVDSEDYIGEQYAPELMVKEAEQFLEQHRDRPFFLYLPFIEPHVALHPPLESVKRFPSEWDRRVYRGESGYLPNARPRAAYAAMINDLDSHVGKVLKKLRDLDLEKNTLVVFTSDNGTTHPGKEGSAFHVGGCDAEFFDSTAGLKGFKGSLYEGGIRVPTIVFWPGVVPAGVSCDYPGYFADWFLTLSSATGIEPPANTDGVDLWPVILGKEAGPRSRPMVWVFPEYGGQVAIRLGDFKIMRRNINPFQEGSRWEVYNLRTDPKETRNLADSQQELIGKAQAILSAQTTPNAIFPLKIPETTQE